MKHVYVGAAVIGAVTGLCFLLDGNRRSQPIEVYRMITWLMIVITYLVVIYGAIYGVASAAFRAANIYGRGALIGKKLGLGWALCSAVYLFSTDKMLNFLFPFFLLAVPVGALCGAALEASLPALSICMIWCIEKVSNICEKVSNICEKGNRVLNPKARRAIELVSLASLIGIVSTFILAYI